MRNIESIRLSAFSYAQTYMCSKRSLCAFVFTVLIHNACSNISYVLMLIIMTGNRSYCYNEDSLYNPFMLCYVRSYFSAYLFSTQTLIFSVGNSASQTNTKKLAVFLVSARVCIFKYGNMSNHILYAPTNLFRAI